MALDPGPGIIDAIWGETKIEPVEKSKPLGRSIETTIGRLDPYRSAQDRSLVDYATKLKGLEGEVNRLSAEDLGTFGGLINRGANYDPTTEFKGLGDYLTGLWGNAAGKIADIGRSRVNLGNAFTYGGKGGGSYGENVLLNNISRNLAPAFTTALAGITPAFQSVSNDRYRNLGSVVDLINQRAGVPFRTADLALLPAEARSRFLQDEIAALGGLGGAVGQNLGGFQSKDNAVRGAMGALNESQDQALDLAMTAASMYFGGGAGGALGGMMGGGGGGGRPPAAAAPTWMPSPPSYSMPPAPNYGQYASMTMAPPPPLPYQYGLPETGYARPGGLPPSSLPSFPGYNSIYGASIGPSL